MKRKILACAIILFSVFSLMVQPVHADCGNVKTAVINCDATDNNHIIASLLAIAVNFLAVGVGLAVLVGIIFGGFLYASAGSNADQAKRGIGHIRNAVIGLMLFIFMYAIINFVIPGGVIPGGSS